MANWVFVSHLEDLTEGVLTPWAYNNQQWVLVRKGDLISGFEDRCSHQNIKLSEFGELQGEVIVCHAHGAMFGFLKGNALSFPAVKCLKPLPLRVRDGRVEAHI